MRRQLIEYLKKVSKMYSEIGDLRRSLAFENASATIKGLPIEVDLKEVIAKKKLQWVGPSIRQDILEFLEKGTTSREEVLKKQTPESLLKESIDILTDFIKEVSKNQ